MKYFLFEAKYYDTNTGAAYSDSGLTHGETYTKAMEKIELFYQEAEGTGLESINLEEICNDEILFFADDSLADNIRNSLI